MRAQPYVREPNQITFVEPHDAAPRLGRFDDDPERTQHLKITAVTRAASTFSAKVATFPIRRAATLRFPAAETAGLLHA